MLRLYSLMCLERHDVQTSNDHSNDEQHTYTSDQRSGPRNGLSSSRNMQIHINAHNIKDMQDLYVQSMQCKQHGTHTYTHTYIYVCVCVHHLLNIAEHTTHIIITQHRMPVEGGGWRW